MLGRDQIFSESEADIYLKSIRRFKTITAEEEITLFKELRSLELEKLENYKEESEKQVLNEKISNIERILFESCARLVVFVAKNYVSKVMPFADLIQEGNIGLIKAIKKFKLGKDCRLSTYAIWWIKQSIMKSLAERGLVARLPLNVYGEVVKLKRHIRILTTRFNREPTIQEILQFTKMSREKINLLLWSAEEMSSLDAGASSGDETPLIEFIEDKKSMKIEDIYLNDLISEHIKDVMCELEDRERLIIGMRFGLYGLKQHTLEEVGNKFGVTRERIRQIETSTLRKLRSYKVLQNLMY